VTTESLSPQEEMVKILGARIGKVVLDAVHIMNDASVSADNSWSVIVNALALNFIHFARIAPLTDIQILKVVERMLAATEADAFSVNSHDAAPQ
jgi:hypothetical protein